MGHTGKGGQNRSERLDLDKPQGNKIALTNSRL